MKLSPVNLSRLSKMSTFVATLDTSACRFDLASASSGSTCCNPLYYEQANEPHLLKILKRLVSHKQHTSTTPVTRQGVHEANELDTSGNEASFTTTRRPRLFVVSGEQHRAELGILPKCSTTLRRARFLSMSPKATSNCSFYACSSRRTSGLNHA